MVAARSALEGRVRRIAVVASPFAVVAAVFAMLPGGMWIASRPYGDGGVIQIRGGAAGGWTIVAWAVMQLTAAVLAWRRPSRKAATHWVLAAFAIDVAVILAWGLTNSMLDDHRLLWRGQMMMVCLGAATVLVLMVLPILVMASERTPPAAPPRARVVGG